MISPLSLIQPVANRRAAELAKPHGAVRFCAVPSSSQNYAAPGGFEPRWIALVNRKRLILRRYFGVNRRFLSTTSGFVSEPLP